MCTIDKITHELLKNCFIDSNRNTKQRSVEATHSQPNDMKNFNTLTKCKKKKQQHKHSKNQIQKQKRKKIKWMCIAAKAIRCDTTQTLEFVTYFVWAAHVCLTNCRRLSNMCTIAIRHGSNATQFIILSCQKKRKKQIEKQNRCWLQHFCSEIYRHMLIARCHLFPSIILIVIQFIVVL